MPSLFDQIMQTLVDGGASLAEEDHGGCTALLCAAKAGHIDAVR